MRYHSGNSNLRGFGHIMITMANVEEACVRFDRLGVPFKKRLADRKMKHIVFILDPDGYWTEAMRFFSLHLPAMRPGPLALA